jgi:hypothetical protein
MHVAYHNGKRVAVSDDESDVIEQVLDSLDVEIVDTEINPEYLTAQMDGQTFSHLNSSKQQDVLFRELLYHIPVNKFARETVLAELDTIRHEKDTPADVSPHDSDWHTDKVVQWIDNNVDSETIPSGVLNTVQSNILDELYKFVDSHWSSVTDSIGNPALADDSEIEAEIDRLESDE